jgi:hypothetical protein
MLKFQLSMALWSIVSEIDDQLINDTYNIPTMVYITSRRNLLNLDTEIDKFIKE